MSVQTEAHLSTMPPVLAAELQIVIAPPPNTYWKLRFYVIRSLE